MASAAFKYVPQSAATTFAFSSVYVQYSNSFVNICPSYTAHILKCYSIPSLPKRFLEDRERENGTISDKSRKVNRIMEGKVGLGGKS